MMSKPAYVHNKVQKLDDAEIQQNVVLFTHKISKNLHFVSE